MNETDWAAVQPVSMPAFLSRFELHDAQFKSMKVDRTWGLEFDIEVDRCWNPLLPAGHDRLLISFDSAWLLRRGVGLRGLSTIAEVQSRVLEVEEREKPFDEDTFDSRIFDRSAEDFPPFTEDLSLTRFALIGEIEIALLHHPDVRIAAPDPSTGTLDVSSLLRS